MVFGKLMNLKRQKPLTDAIPLTIIKLERALVNLHNIGASLRREDNELFERCIEARIRNDSIHAKMYANECAEIRKVARLILSSQYVLEQMILRLNTVKKLNNILITVKPVFTVLNETKGRLVGVVPTVANSLAEVNQILARNLEDMGTSTTHYVEPVSCNEEATKVLEEANLAAETSIRERFPTIPADVKSPQKVKTLIALKEKT